MGIFDRFYRSEKSRRRDAAGSGQGLAIVQRIVELHGSRILVDSQVDRGTRFRFDLPLA
jgi:signal transduction histidine kinase